jgi:hypothetical protein
VLSLALKITLAPALVVAATLAARRWGDRVGGIVIAIPIVAGPVLLVLALDHGRAFVQHAATGALVGIVAVCGFCLAFDRAATLGVLGARAAARKSGQATTAMDELRLPCRSAVRRRAFRRVTGSPMTSSPSPLTVSSPSPRLRSPSA